MKYNLENFPGLYDDRQYKEYINRIIDWTRGFKAELREKLSQPEYSDEYKMFSAEDVIKEILGE